MKKGEPEKPGAREVLESEQGEFSQCDEGRFKDRAGFCKLQRDPGYIVYGNVPASFRWSDMNPATSKLAGFWLGSRV